MKTEATNCHILAQKTLCHWRLETAMNLLSSVDLKFSFAFFSEGHEEIKGQNLTLAWADFSTVFSWGACAMKKISSNDIIRKK